MLALEVAVFGTIAAAMVAWAVGECRESRAAWTMGATLALVHAIAAFVWFYDGSHSIARDETTRQTAALTGIEFSGGICINYLFLAVWMADAAWWWISPASRAQRPRWLSYSIRGFIFFIIANGGVIFADGLARLVGLVCVTMVAAHVRRNWKANDSPAARPLT